jgi:hypothetical protein
MRYELSIRQDNIQAYTDIEHDIQLKLNGLFTFILRINNGKIVDYNVLEFVDARTKYLRLKEITREELVIVHHLDQGTGNTAIRPSNFQCDA